MNRAQEALALIREYFLNRADASMEPGEDRFHGNEEMDLLREVDIIETALAALATAQEADRG